MNAQQVKDAIKGGNKEAQQKALLMLLSVVEAAATGVLEIAGEIQLRTGKDPVLMRTRAILGDFIGLERREA